MANAHSIETSHHPRQRLSSATLRRMFGRHIPADIPLQPDGSTTLEAVMPHIEHAHAAAMRTAIYQEFIVTPGTLEAQRDS